MAWYRAGGGGIPSSLKTGMNSVLNKKFGTATTYDPAGWPDDVNLMGPLPEKTASGAIASFSDGADTVPCKSVKCSVVASGGNGTPSTPVPIVGASSVTVKQRGKNLLNPTLYDGGAYNPTVDSQRTFTESETQFTHVGNTYSVTFTESWKNFTMLIPVKYGQAYYCNFTLSGTGKNLGTSVYYVDSDNKVMASASNNTINPQTRAIALNVPSGAKLYCITFTNRGTAETTLTFTEPQLEVGSLSSTYEPYNAIADVTAQIGQTVYGGTYDFNTGVFTATHERIVVTSTANISRSDGKRYYIVNSKTGARIPSADEATVFSDKLKSMVGGGQYDDIVWLNNSGAIRWNTTTDYSSIADMLADFGGSIEFVYPLATPIEITGLDTHTFETALGVNNFWCDTCDSEVTYRRDIDLALGGN